MKKVAKIICILLAGILLCGAGCGIYLSDYYRAAPEAAAAMESDPMVQVQTGEGRIVFSPAEPEAGFLFYPGGKVEYTAYAPLMRALAENGILCVLLEMPGNLAVLDMDAAEGIPEQFPSIRNWYIGGHSLGGSMAAAYVSEHSDDFEGLILLAAYSTADLSDTGLKVLLLRGDQDGVLNLEKYEKNLKNLPEYSFECVISGGNHASFGSYGHQEGDGTPGISPEEQIRQTVQEILTVMAA